jgi:hypothetical protein
MHNLVLKSKTFLQLQVVNHRQEKICSTNYESTFQTMLRAAIWGRKQFDLGKRSMFDWEYNLDYFLKYLSPKNKSK